MKFDGGYLGACIIVLSLLLGTAGCLLLNVNETPVSTTRYDYVTDITGLFNISDEPQYIDFNPATNYTGYLKRQLVPTPEDPTGISYTSTPTANNYRILTRAGDTMAGPSGTVDNSTSLAQASFTYTPRSGQVPNTDNVNNTAVVGYLTGMKVSSVYSWVSSIFTLSDYSAIQMDITYPANHKPTEKGGFCTYVYDTTGDDPHTSIPASRYQAIRIDPSNMTCQFKYNNSWGSNSYSLYDCYIIYGDAIQHEIYLQPGPAWASGDYSTSLSFSYTSQVTTTNEYAYMVPSDGVRISSSSGITTWDNDTTATDYDNHRIDVLVGGRFINGVYTLPSSISLLEVCACSRADFNAQTYSAVGITYNGGWQIKIYSLVNNNIIEEVPQFDGGDFKAFMLSFERNADDHLTITVYGVLDIINYTNATVAPIPLASMETTLTNDLDELTFYGVINDLAWSVYNTNINMNTYNAVMINPSIDLEDYWADMDSYRYAFQSFAIYGDSVTINGETYTIEDEQITIDGKKYKFNNVWLSFSAQGKTSITFRDINRTIDLGDTQDKEVSFSGIWYFTTGLYEGVETSEDVYEWDINDPLGKLDLDTIFLLALGGLAIISLIFIALKFNFKPMDKVILIFGGVIFFCLLGGF